MITVLILTQTKSEAKIMLRNTSMIQMTRSVTAPFLCKENTNVKILVSDVAGLQSVTRGRIIDVLVNMTTLNYVVDPFSGMVIQQPSVPVQKRITKKLSPSTIKQITKVITLPASKSCECGAEKTFGPHASHAVYCPKA